MLLDNVQRQVMDHGLIRPGDRGAVALSGGPDSLCLLHLLWRLSQELDMEILALHVDHGLRPESAEEAEQAAALARDLGLEAEVLEAELPPPEEPGNLQERAREARLALLAAEAQRRACRWVALGHTATDQAETVVMRAIRGAGLQGLAGMAPGRAPFIRPLLTITRPEVRRYLEHHALSPLEDPSNATDRFLRNRVRHHVLPLLERENPAVVEALCRLADGCRQDHEALEAMARQALDGARRDDGLDVAELVTLLPGILHRVLRQAYAEVTGSTRRLTRAHVEQMARLLGTTEGSASLDLPGIRLLREYHLLRWIEPGEPTPGSGVEQRWLEPVQITGPGEVPLPDGRTLLVGYTGPDAQGTGQVLNPGRAPFPLTVRGLVSGDRLAVGPQMSRKVARLLLDAKIPRGDRWRVPLVFCGDVLVAVVGVRVAHGHAGQPGSSGLEVKLT